MTTDTRGQFLDSAEKLFAERGFYGVSIAAIGDELGLTKQALLHHFKSKEKLYGEVLAQISARIEEIGITAAGSDVEPKLALKAYLLELHSVFLARPDQARLLMRELLDNKRRADTAGTWYLKPFLERLVAMIKAQPNWQNASDGEALALGYQLLGAITYFGVSEPTLKGIFGAEGYADLDESFKLQLERMIDAAVATRGR